MQNVCVGFVSYAALESYLRSVKKFDELTAKFLVEYFFEGKTEVSLIKFINVCKRLVVREVKAEAIDSVLSRIKYSFVSQQVLIDDIYGMLAKGSERLSIGKMRESLSELKINVTYEEFEMMLLAFDIERDLIDPNNFYYVIKKTKVEHEFAPNKKIQKVSSIIHPQTDVPIALSPRQEQGSIKCIRLEDYLMKVQSETELIDRPITTRSASRRTPSTVVRMKQTADKLMTEKLCKFSKRLSVKSPSKFEGSDASIELSRVSTALPGERVIA